MTNPLRPLEQALDEARAAWAAARPAFSSTPPGDAQGEIEQMSNAGVVAVTDAIAQLRRDADAMLARLASEVARRSSAEFGADGLAKQQGFHNPVRLLAASTGGTTAEAAKLIAVGESTRSRSSFTGERLPARHPAVAAALEKGSISTDAAGMITAMLERVRPRVDHDRALRYESELVAFATGNSLSLVTRAVKLAEARLDQDGLEPRDEERWQQRSLTIREDSNGMLLLNARLDPATAAPVKAALEAMVTDALHRRRDGDVDVRSHAGGAGEGANSAGTGAVGEAANSAGAGAVGEAANSAGTDGVGEAANSAGAGAGAGASVIADTRTIPQMQADALAELARHCLGCTVAPAPAAKTTVIVRMDLDALSSRLGVATVDGIDQPIAASTARRLCADAELIPVVLGGGGLPLDLGRSARLFTRAQRLALAERDGGCASCGQNIAYVDAHHIRWWERHLGRTDLSNGVLLCSFCHHMIHRDGWQITASPGEVWFIPPPHVDPHQKPRLGGRARFELSAVAA
ncbi:HNH endonuclease signature motif containing protein [Agromyces sp. Marseille-P2726]|uniref:HNH endonuclease signature motif containing protein n=1 Tax=Agromyces sp. Marseille-P2726 TaxID=2709132 RepID=UPI00156F8A01|nr:HNH endonuclease signature motif containing protein [Agromyces sp. Marseille-P2726]